MATADFLRTELFHAGDPVCDVPGWQLRVHRGYLTTSAFLLAALLELMQAVSVASISTCMRARAHAAAAVRRSTGSGFFFTSHDHEALFHRAKPVRRQRNTGGNGVAASRCSGWRTSRAIAPTVALQSAR